MAGFEAVCRHDEAIDALAMGEDAVRKYRETGDVTVLKFRDGIAPTRFHCRTLKPSEMRIVGSALSDVDRNWEAFVRGVTKVTGLRSDDGTRRDFVRQDNDRPIASSVVDQTFDAGEVDDIGARIYGASILGKGRPAAWPQPATLRHAVGALVFRLAEQTRAQDAASPPSNPPAAGAPPETTGP